MKSAILLLLILSICSFSANAQSGADNNSPSNTEKIPIADVKDLDGKTISTASFSNNGKPILVVFWNSVHKFPTKELEALQDNYENWKTRTGVKIIVISIDDSRTASRVAPMVNAKGWDFEFYLDINSDFKRAMNVNLVPHTFLINGSGEIVWQMVAFEEGNEFLIYDELKKIKN